MPDDRTEKKAGPPDDGTIVIGPADLAKSHAKACLVALAGWEIGREIELADHEHVIGRTTTAHTQINSLSISREHAKITCIDSESGKALFITDLNSSNGTHLNNQVLTAGQPAPLSSGSQIELGQNVIIRFDLI